tara:strand:+ start:13444 stop:13644 length:201 start_codon:yes stop_codon:yes gene_type:complete
MDLKKLNIGKALLREIESSTIGVRAISSLSLHEIVINADMLKSTRPILFITIDFTSIYELGKHIRC